MRSTITIFVLAFAALGLLLGYSESYDAPEPGAIELAAGGVEDRIDRIITAMLESSELPSVQSTEYLDAIDSAQMGISEDDDVEKREAARDVLAEHPEIASIFFLTPSGDIYIGEPYDQQEQLPRLNYADRDWYKGVSATNDAYVSSVFMSAAIHVPAIAVAVPVHLQGEAAGYWVAIVDVSGIDSSLRNFGESRILLLDHNGTQVADTGLPLRETTELKSFAGLQSVDNALAGRSGVLAERVDGKEMIATYAPVRAYPHTWAIVFLEPAG